MRVIKFIRLTLGPAALGVAVWNLATAAIVIFTGVISLDRNVDYIMAGFHIFLSTALIVLVWNDCVAAALRVYAWFLDRRPGKR